MIRRFIFALMFALVATAASAQVADDPAALREQMLEHRRLEAAAKEKSVRKHFDAAAKATVNQGQYDVTHYDLVVSLDPIAQILTGTVTTTTLVTGTSIGTLDLDLDSVMTVSGATSAGIAAATSRNGDVITVTLDRTYATGETVVVAVSYSGDPALAGGTFGAAFGWSSHNNEDMIWTLSEPFGARAWWPCKDLNSDKADSMDITVTVPSNLIVGSNGTLVSDITVGDERTFHWQTHYPIATYLVSLAVHPYVVYSDWYTPQAGGDPMEVQFFIYPDHVGVVEPTYALTVPMIDHFARGYGEYPFVDEKYGHAEFVWGGGMEHQTLTSMGGWSMDLISHELAHQWWGDMVTCDDFSHIWLNEGFATWSEAYWAETYLGAAAYAQYMSAAAYYGGGTIYVEDPLNDSIFDSNLSYNKGSWIVHMLRGVLGDTDFFAGLALYRSTYLYGSATTENLRDALETVSGKDLDAFFQQWIYGDYFPVYRSSWTPGAAPGEIVVTLEQIQDNTGLFTMPVPLRITTDQGVFDVTVENSLALEEYALAVDGTVELVSIDPDRWILRKVETTVTDASLDQGILLVNGVLWDTYGTEITGAYADSICSGNQPFAFWDCFAEPGGGYDPGLPAPLGHGAVPAEIIGNFSTVVWVGNNYGGDLPPWQETPILSYLEAGGNVLLLTRMSADFLGVDLADYLDVNYSDTGATLVDCTAVATGLIDIPFTGSQSLNDAFMTNVGPESEVLFVDSVAFGATRGTGALRTPSAGGTFREDGGKFALVGGRPYRMDHTALRHNTDYILTEVFGEPYLSLSPVEDAPRREGALHMGRNYPNPFNPQTVIPFALPRTTGVTLNVYDARGRLVRELVRETLDAGDHEIRWDGLDHAGRSVPSGTYFARLRTDEGQQATTGLVLLR